MKLFFRKSGEGTPLVILHGLFGLSDNWATLSKQFQHDGFLVYAVDLRNHGRSPQSGAFSFEVMAEDLMELFRDEQLTSACFIGHSLGAKVAMFFACLHPEKVSRLLVADMSPRMYPPHHQAVVSAIHSVDLASLSSRKEAESALRETLRDEATIQFLLKNLYRDEANRFRWRFYLPGIEKNMEETGKALPESFRFSGPTLFLTGEQSGYVTPDDEALIRKHFPDAAIETIPDAGHWIHAENPAGFYEAAIRFLKR